MTMLSSAVAAVLPSAVETSVKLFFSPRIPTLLYPLLQGARLLEPVFRQRWKEFGAVCRTRHISAAEAVRMARRGFIPECHSTPFQFRPPREPNWSAAELQQMIPLHSELLAGNVIEPVPPPNFADPMIRLAMAAALCYYGGSPFMVPALVMPFVHIWFTVPKPHSDKRRPVSAMGIFNEFLIPRHFKMEGLHSLQLILRPLDFMTVIDIKAAFPTLGIHPRYRNYFIFQFRGKFYRYRGSVFGISSLPRAWTKLLRPVMAFLRSFGIRLVIFSDDILVAAASFAACAQDTQDVLTILQFLGFVISDKESVKLIPAQRQIWCGALICTLTMELLLPPTKLRDLVRKCRQRVTACSAGTRFTLRGWASTLGLLRSTHFALRPALLWSQPLNRFVNPFISTNVKCWDRILPLPPAEVLDCLQQFISRAKELNGRPIRPPPADLLTDSDSSDFGGGMVMDQPIQSATRWHWLPEEAQQHINMKELKVHLRGLQALDLETPGLLLNRIISNRCDNSVSVAYVNRQGGRIPALSREAESLFTWLMTKNSWMSDQFLAGVLNERADTESRWEINPAEYMLLPWMFRALNQRWGPFTVDAFASRLNKQMLPFWSRYLDPDAHRQDAFRQNWSGHNLWILPPHVIVGKCLAELRKQRVTRATIVVPIWPSQPWWSLLLQMTVDYQLLGPSGSVLKHPTKPLAGPPALWMMGAFKVCFNVTNSRASLSRISTDLWLRGALPERN